MEFIEDRRPFLLKPVPVFIRNAACACMILFYLLVKYVLTPYLPEKWFVDTQKIAKIIGGDMTMEGGSFAAAAHIYAMFPGWSLGLIVTCIGIVCIIAVFRVTNTWRGIIVAFSTLIPLLLLGLLVPLKDTMVFVMTLVILAINRFNVSRTVFIASIVVIYLLFGLNIRVYYLLIMGIWLGLLIFPVIPKPVSLLLLFIGTVAFFFLPSEIFHTLQGSRDFVYQYTEYASSTISRRTGFHNPFPPDNPLAFIANYIHAFVLLHFPFFRFFGIKEIILFINVLIYGWLLFRGWSLKDDRIKILVKLFSAHLLVLWLFEPDLGSYFRHFSTVFLYLVPVFAFLERDTEFFAKKAAPPHPCLLQLQEEKKNSAD